MYFSLHFYVFFTCKTQLKKANVIDQVAVQKAWCYENGYEHHVQTENEIRKNRLLLSNLKLILKIIKHSNPTDIDKYRINKILKEKLPQRITLQVLSQNTKLTPNKLYMSIGWMIFNGEIQSNISQSHFGMNTEVWINE